MTIWSMTSPARKHGACTVGSQIIESLRAEKRVSTGAHGAPDDPLVVQAII